MQVRTSKNPGIEATQRQWLTVIRLKYLGSFARTGRNELDSNLAACEDAVAYLAKLANQIDGKQLAAEEKEPSAAAL